MTSDVDLVTNKVVVDPDPELEVEDAAAVVVDVVDETECVDPVA